MGFEGIVPAEVALGKIIAVAQVACHSQEAIDSIPMEVYQH